MIQEATIEHIINAVDIVDYIGKSVDLKKKGARHWGKCPFHQEKTGSFAVSQSKGSYYCFGCHKGGNIISFVMEYENLNFVDAVKKLASISGIEIREDEPSEEDRQKSIKKEAMFILNANVAKWYQEQYLQNKRAKEYVVKRWDIEFAQEFGVGYAPAGWNNLYEIAKKKCWSIELLLELGLLRKSEEKGSIYDFYRDRIVIPVRNQIGQIIAFTCRDISNKPDVAKYLNSCESLIYSKEKSFFGIDTAHREIVKKDKVYLVEGAPDVIRLHSISVYNSVACLGSQWTSAHFEMLKRLTYNICFIPDADVMKGDTLPAGIASVMKYGEIATQLGFNVTVKEIPLTEDGKKNDPDSYCVAKKMLDDLPEEDYIIWLAEKLLHNKDTTQDIHDVIKQIASLVIEIKEETKQDMFLSRLQRVYKNKQLWEKTIKFARKQKKAQEVLEHTKKIDRDLYQKYGFYEMYGGYASMGDSSELRWCNFTLEPMFHIRDAINPKRLYRIKNENGFEEIIEMKQEDLISLSKFKLKVEGLGNYIWEVGEKQLTKLKKMLYEQTETATEIIQLGYNRTGHFYAFGNGIFDGVEWHATDDFGIVRLSENRNYYLPGSSVIYENDEGLFQFERKFVHTAYSNISLNNFAEMLIRVFGDNAKIGICYLIATLFRDIVVNYTRSFPILNLFGPKGSGKSELGHSLMSCFIIKNAPVNLTNATIPAMADAVAQVSNALVHLDEFKNSIDLEKREFLKGLWDGNGRSRMNMDKDKKREMTNVDSGIILSGQEMATADIALFSRFVYLTFSKSEFTDLEKKHFRELEDARNKGFSHITLQILRHRPKFEQLYYSQYKICTDELLSELGEEVIEDRIFRNWLAILAAYKTIENYIDVPFTYKELLSIFKEYIIKQNDECKTNNELAAFWNVVNYLYQEGEIFLDSDYKISYLNKLKTDKFNIESRDAIPYLVLRRSRIFMLYKKYAKMTGEPLLPESSLRYYLEKSKEFRGIKQSVRFKTIYRNGYEETKAIKDPNSGIEVLKKTSNVEMGYFFDWKEIKRNYSIDLEVYIDQDTEEHNDSDKYEQQKIF